MGGGIDLWGGNAGKKGNSGILKYLSPSYRVSYELAKKKEKARAEETAARLRAEGISSAKAHNAALGYEGPTRTPIPETEIEARLRERREARDTKHAGKSYGSGTTTVAGSRGAGSRILGV